MPDVAALSALVMAYALVMVTPGPNLLIVLRASLMPPRRAALTAALGVASGAALTAALASVLAGAVTASYGLTVLGQVLFAGLLARAGIRSLRGLHQGGVTEQSKAGSGRSNVRALSQFRLGLVTALLNPITTAFFASASLGLPRSEVLRTALVLWILVFSMVACWFGLLALIFIQPVARAAYTRGWQYIEFVVGLLLFACAARILYGIDTFRLWLEF
jgi:amino acid exporter